MPPTTPREYLKAFRFAVAFGTGEVVESVYRLAGRGSVGLEAVHSDPFHREELWLAAPLARDLPTLRAHVDHELQRAASDADAIARHRGKMSVFLFGADNEIAKRIDLSFSSYDWLPLDLNARREENAAEWLVLKGVRYGDEEAP